MTSFDVTVLSYDENKTSLGFFGRVILIFEGKINSTDGAKSEHCYALCSRIRLGFESKMWYLDVLKSAQGKLAKVIEIIKSNAKM